MTDLADSTDAGQILVLEPDAVLREAVTRLLSSHGFQAHPAVDLAAAEAVLAREAIDIVVLEVRLPGEEGLGFCRTLARDGRARVIIVSQAASEIDRVLGLEFGADDYLGKPFSPRELLARVRAIRRRQGRAGRETGSGPPVYVFGGLVLDAARRELRTGVGEAVALAAGVMDLLQVFVEHPKRLLSRDDLIAAAGLHSDVDARAVDMRVSRIRQTLRALGGRELIRTIRGSGYVLDAEVTVRGPERQP